jgi:2-polyprenyl-6-methoxyphenol hydroxylase and related FAD-dependent oxidoreductases
MCAGFKREMSRTPVLIVGAGPTGLVLALWLTKSGIAVRIIDKVSEPGTTSRALAVQARTLEFYRQLDIASDVVEAGVNVAAVNLWVRGRRAVRASLADIGRGLSPFSFPLVYPQDEHEKLLIERWARWECRSSDKLRSSASSNGRTG